MQPKTPLIKRIHITRTKLITVLKEIQRYASTDEIFISNAGTSYIVKTKVYLDLVQQREDLSETLGKLVQELENEKA